MPSNHYHLLSFLPATEAWEMPPALEALAQQWVRSGVLRISTETEKNFVRLGTADTDQTFTARDLSDPLLLPTTRQKLARHVAPAAGAQGLADLEARLLNDLRKARGVSARKEIMVARVLVQAAHPSVIRLLMMSRTEVFISYAHSVGELMEVRHWETHGVNSGLQATEATGTAVYLSAGGDPFFEGTQKHYTTDGFPALARMVVIAGQEFGHFADLRRGREGSIIGRHSTDAHHQQLRADPRAADGRLADMRTTAALSEHYARAGLERLRRAERGVAFYHARYRFTPPWLMYQLTRGWAWAMFVVTCRRQGHYQPLRTLPYHRRGEATEMFLSDMAFNLAPDADVYRDPDPLVEEAIAVIEAVARVPQQVHKWGHAAVQRAWPNLYGFYFGTVIPAAEALAPLPTGINKTKLLQRIKVFFRRQLRPKPGYYP